MLSTDYQPAQYPDDFPGLEARLIPGRYVYTINQIGHVRSCLKRGGFGHRDYWKPVSIHLHPKRHWIFTFGRRGERNTVSVASLVLETFVGPAPTKDHRPAFLDHDTLNHCLWNLQWMTAEEAFEHELPRAGGTTLERARRDDLAHDPAFGRGSKEPLTSADIERSLTEWQAGRKLRHIWRERYRHRSNLTAFTQRVYMLRKKRRRSHEGTSWPKNSDSPGGPCPSPTAPGPS